jgi:peptidyl-prolyl cis-trans isomerase C
VINQKSTIAILSFLFLFSVAGCDKLTTLQEYFFPAKKEKPAPAGVTAQKETARPEPNVSVGSPKPVAEQGEQAQPAAPAAMAQDVLAKVGNWTLTLSDFKDRLAALKQAVPNYDINNTEQNKLILEELVRQELLVQEAEKKGLDKNKDIQQAVNEFRRTLLVREIAGQLTKDIKVTDEEAKEYYDANKADFAEPTQWRVREIVVDTEGEANSILADLKNGADFVEKVKEKSKSKSAWQKGDLGFKTDFDFPKMKEVVSALKVGDISSVFKGPEGYYIVKLEEKKGGEPQPFENIKEDIINGLTLLKQQKAILAHLDELRKKTDIQVNTNLLEE